MSENDVIKIVFGLLLSLGAIVLFFLSFKVFYGYMVQEKRCTQKTKGIVNGYAQTPGNGIYLPKVHYTVNNKVYKVIGPRFRYYRQTTLISSLSNNETGFHETEKQGFVVNRTANSVISIRGNPMCILYPKGSNIDVFYDPTNPKLSYVLRYCNLKWGFWLMFISALGVSLTCLAILILL